MTRVLEGIFLLEESSSRNNRLKVNNNRTWINCFRWILGDHSSHVFKSYFALCSKRKEFLSRKLFSTIFLINRFLVRKKIKVLKLSVMEKTPLSQPCCHMLNLNLEFWIENQTLFKSMFSYYFIHSNFLSNPLEFMFITFKDFFWRKSTDLNG